ncbi:MAG TPA: hypothetical protein VM735_02665, partial [Candidatus Kapabacteria bacterium]|nr:hypothetical protein [Candidatus Kapabacteria bacterium]
MAEPNRATSQKGTLSSLQGITIVNETNLPAGIDFAVHSSQVGRQHPIVQKLIAGNVTVLSDLELSARNLFCLSVAITG